MATKTTKKTTAKKKTAKAAPKKNSKGAVKNAERFLCDAPTDRCFWVNNGWIIRNIAELPLALDNMADDVFSYHVNKEKNDFYNWVKDVIGDDALAKEIKAANKRKDMLSKVKTRITQLKR